ncbi:MAG: hypothetical protein F4Z77_04945 [Dehalococcoidia bacterium]|nr:hypothetical protein [Dehalococcoidia bacterium]MYA52846.1 hypothetical protein [Dehalococcoidia bacterium]
MPQVADLASLQDYDDILARLTAELEEARADLENEEALRAAEGAVAEADERCAALERDQRRLEGEIDTLVARVEREEKKLYDGSTSLPKELEGLQREIASVRSHLSDVEDTELALLDRLEEAEAARDEAHAGLKREQGEAREKAARLGGVIARLEGEMAATSGERDTCRGRLTATLIAQYEDLRRRKGGVAVTHLRAGACTGCRVSVPPSARKRALDPEAPALCPNCERILVGY